MQTGRFTGVLQILPSLPARRPRTPACERYVASPGTCSVDGRYSCTVRSSGALDVADPADASEYTDDVAVEEDADRPWVRAPARGGRACGWTRGTAALPSEDVDMCEGGRCALLGDAVRLDVDGGSADVASISGRGAKDSGVPLRGVNDARVASKCDMRWEARDSSSNWSSNVRETRPDIACIAGCAPCTAKAAVDRCDDARVMDELSSAASRPRQTNQEHITSC